MAKIYGHNDAVDFAAKNLITFNGSFARGAGQPLDKSSVWYPKDGVSGYDRALAYAATDAAYVGQELAVIDVTYAEDGTTVTGTSVKFYGIQDANGTLKELGAKPTGDNATISVDAAGLVSIFGFAGAQNNSLPVRENGALVWKTLEDIGAGDGNDNTTYEFAVNEDGNGFVVTPLFNDQPIMEGEEGAQTQVKYDIVLDVYTKDEADNKFLTKEEAYDDTALANRVTATETAITDEASARDAADKVLEGKIAEALAEAKQYADDNDADTIYNDEEVRGLINGVATRVGTLETTVGDSTKGLVKGLADEITRATEAEADLDERLDAIEADYIDSAELADAIKNFATTQYVDEEIEAIEDAISKLNHFTTKVVASVDEVTDTGVLYLIKDESVKGVDKYNEYIVVDNAPVLIGDTTTDLSNYYDKDAIDNKVETLEGAIADEIDAREALAEEVAALKAVDNATQKELDDYKDVVTLAIATAKGEAIADADGKLANKLDKSTFETFKGENTTAIATAKQEAIEAAATAEEAKGYAVAADVARDYATKDELADEVEAIEAALNDYAKTADVNTELAKKVESATIVHASETKSEGVTKNGAQLEIVVDAYTKQETRDYVAGVIEDMTGGESAADVKLALENHVKTYTEKVGQIDVKNGEQDTAIAAAQAQADKGVSDAATAKQVADNAVIAIAALSDGQVTTNKNAIATLTELVSGDGEDSHATRIGVLESYKTTHNADFNTLKGRVDNAETELAKKINSDDVYTKTNVDGLLADKADKSAVYTKEEVETKLTAAKEAAIAGVDLTPFAKTADVNAAIVTINEAINTKANASDVATTVAGINETIATLAVKSDVEAALALKATKEELKDYAKSADLASYYTKGEADAEFATADEVKSIIDEVVATVSDTDGINKLVDLVTIANTHAGMEALTDLSGRVEVVEGTLAGIEGTVAATINAAKEAAIAAIPAADVADNKAKLVGITGTVAEAITAAKNEAIAAIPALEIATAEKLGGIKSAANTVNNAVSVDATTGIASVSRVSVSSLVQDEQEVLVLDGGNATA